MPGRMIPTSVSASFRFIFILVFGVTGFLIGREVDLRLIALHVESGIWQESLRIAAPVIGALAGVTISPFVQSIFEDGLALVEVASEALSSLEVIGATAGLCLGLTVSILLRTLFASIVTLVGLTADAVVILLATLLCVFATYIGLRVASRERRSGMERREHASLTILDTSAIIDGRIVDVVRTGFLVGPLLVPRFILAELQGIADSSDAQRRVRGRRGLELLNDLRGLVDVMIEDDPVGEGQPADARLLRLARVYGARLLTTDFNLNRVALVEGLGVLNVNELAKALRPTLQTGEELAIAITRDGREPQQGVGYLEDGTMVVVEGGQAHRGENISVVVTSVIQTAAGRMIFAKVR